MRISTHAAIGVLALLVNACPEISASDDAEFDHTFRVAAELQNRALYSIAAKRWSKLIKDAPDYRNRPLAHYYLAICQIHTKNDKGAKESLKSLINEFPEFKNIDAAKKLLESNFDEIRKNKAPIAAEAAQAIPGRVNAANEVRAADKVVTQRPKSFANSIGMKFNLVPAGEFKMGSHESLDRLSEIYDSRFGPVGPFPARETKIEAPFYLGGYEVTCAQFRQFVEATGYKTDAETRKGRGARFYNASTGIIETSKPHCNWRNTGWKQTDAHPVVNVSWNDAKAFCWWLSEREERDYRLPKGAEWEYACRAGSVTRYSFGDNAEKLVKHGNVGDPLMLDVLPGYGLASGGRVKSKDGFSFSAPVGKFKANAFGLHDMHGNAWEWVLEPVGDDSATMRGGGWTSFPMRVRSAHLATYKNTFSTFDAGFRVALALPADPLPTTNPSTPTAVPAEIELVTPAIIASALDPPAKSLQHARELRATLNPFRGFKADVSINLGGQRLRGTLEVDSKGAATIEVSEKHDPSIVQWAEDRIEDVIKDHLPTKNDGAKYEYGKANSLYPFYRPINVVDDEQKTVYRPGEGGIRQIERTRDGLQMTTTVLDVEKFWENKFVSKSFMTSTRDAVSGRLQQTETYTIDWITLPGYVHLPTSISMVKTPTDSDSSFGGIRLRDHVLVDRKRNN